MGDYCKYQYDIPTDLLQWMTGRINAFRVI